MTNKACVINLKNVDLEKVHKKYNIVLPSNITDRDNNKNDKTILSDINIHGGCNQMSFLDESKKMNNCQVTMIDSQGKNGIYLGKSDVRYHCFWCRNEFDSRVLGCPVKYYPSKYFRVYNSKITGEISSCSDVSNGISSSNMQHGEEVSREYYLCDGIFCSFNCILAFIKDNSRDPRYEDSCMLLNNIYSKVHNTLTFNITPAPHWRMLKEYGGSMSIKEFRKNFNKYMFTGLGNVDDIDFSRISFLFKEDIKISKFI